MADTSLAEKYHNLTGKFINVESIEAAESTMSDAEKAHLIGRLQWDIPGGIADAKDRLKLKKEVYDTFGPVSGDVNGDGVEDSTDDEIIENLSTADIDFGSDDFGSEEDEEPTDTTTIVE